MTFFTLRALEMHILLLLLLLLLLPMMMMMMMMIMMITSVTAQSEEFAVSYEETRPLVSTESSEVSNADAYYGTVTLESEYTSL